MKQTGLSLILMVIIIGALVTILLVGIIASRFNTNQTVTLDISSEINEFPVYPNAEFIKKDVVAPCEEELPGYTICNANAYTWEINDTVSNVLEWYKKNTSSVGWKKDGGAGALDEEKDGSGVESFKKGNLIYYLHFSGNPSPTTLTLEIPLGPRQILPSSICAAENTLIKSLVINLEYLQKEKDAEGVLALFTPPTTLKDIETYNSFLGKDNNPLPRLYRNATTNINLIDFEIIGTPINNQNKCTVNVEEKIRPYSNAGSNIGYGEPEIFKFSFDIVKEGDNWLIDKYYPTGQTPTKYGAWGY